MKIGKEKFLIILTVLVDVIGMGIIIPILPFYVEQFNSSPVLITWLFASFSLFAFFSAPLLGAWSDRIGRRPVLIISIVSTAIGWFVFASAHSLIFLFLGRIIDGLAAGNFPIAQSYLVDISSSEKEKTTNLGVIGAVFGIGFIVGPAIGAALSTISPAFPFWFVGGLATLNAIGAYFFLPETNHHKHVRAISLNPFAPITKAFRDKPLHSRYLAFFLLGLAFSSMQSIFALFMAKRYGFDAKTVGMIFTLMGVIMVFNQGYLLKRFWLKFFPESFLETWLFLIKAASFILLAIPTLPTFFAGVILMTFTQAIIRVVLTSRASNMAGPQRRGEVLGIMASIISISTILGPLGAGFLFELSDAYPFLASAVILMIAFFIMKLCCRNGSQAAYTDGIKDTKMTLDFS